MRGYRHQFESEVWQAPSGFVDEGEEPAATARRELEEETAFNCAPEHILPLGTLMPDAGLIEARVALFAALECQPSANSAVAEPGAGKLSWLTVSEAEMIARNDPNIGASTVVAIERYAHHIKGQ
jgi:8-oxo-dGTP pyrophosphatase MutT (NUDIX family)